MYQIDKGRLNKHPLNGFACAIAKHRVLPAAKCSGQNAGNHGSRRYPRGIEDIGFKMLQGPKLLLADSERTKLDNNPDTWFYCTPRMMQHADPELLAALTDLYLQVVPAGGTVLELCASCHSHLPQGLQLAGLVGQGMNEAELVANKALSRWFVQDLNQQPLLSEQLDNSYDAVLCVNGIQYLTQPETVLAEAHRLLRPGGLLCVAFGSHCFPEKAIAAWLSRSMDQRAELVRSVLQANGFDKILVLASLHSIQQWLSSAAGKNLVTAAATATDLRKDGELCVLLAQKPSVSAANVTSAIMEPDKSSTKAGVAAALAKLNEAQAGTKRVQNFELKEEKAVYDVVDEDEYAQLVTKRRIEAGDFLEDDDGEYMDMGEEDDFFKGGEQAAAAGSKKRKDADGKGGGSQLQMQYNMQQHRP
eukprot:gene8339-8524_t